MGTAEAVVQTIMAAIESADAVTDEQLSTLYFIFEKNLERALRILDQGGVQRVISQPSQRSVFQARAQAAGQASRSGFNSDVHVGNTVGNALVNMYSKVGSIEGAGQVFDQVAIRDVISWTIISIGAYSGTGCGDEAFRLYLQLPREGDLVCIQDQRRMYVVEAFSSTCTQRVEVLKMLGMFSGEYIVVHNEMIDAYGEIGRWRY